MIEVRDGDAVLLAYTEPLLRDHGSLRDLTGKSGEGKGLEGCVKVIVDSGGNIKTIQDAGCAKSF